MVSEVKTVKGGKTAVIIVTDGYVTKSAPDAKTLQSLATVVTTPPKAGIPLYRSELKVSYTSKKSNKKTFLSGKIRLAILELFRFSTN